MKKQTFLIALLIVLSINSFSQIVFEDGYFMNESGQRIDCLIKNADWKNNPSEFEYKISKDDPVQKSDIQKVKEFGITGVSKYIRAKVNIDRSSDNVTNLSTTFSPIFQKEELFLKVLIEGKASLFIYEEGNLTRFFFKTDDSEINQLVYKRSVNEKYDIAVNNQFRQQLFVSLKCPKITLRDIEHINYYKRDLEKLFLNYNSCLGSDFTNYESKTNRDLFNLSVRPGINSSTLAIRSLSSDSRNTDFKNEFKFRFGIETEFILPFNKNKWSLIVEPTYQYYNSKKTMEESSVSGGILVAKVDYKSVELPIGLRHYFFINEKSKTFINASYIFEFSNNSMIDFFRNDGSSLNSVEINSRNNLAFGIGYKYKDKYGIEMRYQTSREILGDYVYWDSDYKTLSIILGYSLF